MEKFELQRFDAAPQAVAGKKVVYLFRPFASASTMDGTVLAFTTENGRSKSKDADSTTTKDGKVRTPGEVEQEVTATTLLKKGDTMIKALEDAMDSDGLIECWEANLEEPATGGNNKYKGKYFQGYLTSFEKTSNAEDNVEISLTFGINGAGVDGDVTVTASQQAVADYVFRDTPAITGP